MHVAIVGAGWYGAHLALELAKQGHTVTLIEKNKTILSETSGTFGVRLHRGPHYPRSSETRKGCEASFEQFKATYPELLVKHSHSIYAYGLRDAKNLPSQVTLEAFRNVCKESASCEELNPQGHGFNPEQIKAAFNLDESSIVVGKALRDYFDAEFKKHGVNVKTGAHVHGIKPHLEQFELSINGVPAVFDKVINATGFQALLPTNFSKEFPMPIQPVYPVCIGLMIKDKRPEAEAFSFIVMDGMFPGILPYVEKRSPTIENYLLTHASWTTLGSCATPQEAHALLQRLYADESVVSRDIAPEVFADMERFWPGFSERFEYVGWKGTVLCKLRNANEFRTAFTFEDPNGVIHVGPGKIQNAIQVGEEVTVLLNSKPVPHLHPGQPTYRFDPKGVLASAKNEVSTKPSNLGQSSCDQQTLDELKWLRLRELMRYQSGVKKQKGLPNVFSDDNIRGTLNNTVARNYFFAINADYSNRPSTAPTRQRPRVLSR